MIEVIITSIFLGLGLSMDACAVSMANGLNEPKMKISKMSFICLIFALFQGIMPLMGYFIGDALFKNVEWIIPILSLVLLSLLGIKMIIDSRDKKEEVKKVTVLVILLQAIATSIDALSVGFTMSNYSVSEALVSVLFISLVTFLICYIGTIIGKKFGTKLENVAEIAGGIILMVIGIEIFIKGMFFL